MKLTVEDIAKEIAATLSQKEENIAQLQTAIESLENRRDNLREEVIAAQADADTEKKRCQEEIKAWKASLDNARLEYTIVKANTDAQKAQYDHLRQEQQDYLAQLRGERAAEVKKWQELIEERRAQLASLRTELRKIVTSVEAL